MTVNVVKKVIVHIPQNNLTSDISFENFFSNLEWKKNYLNMYNNISTNSQYGRKIEKKENIIFNYYFFGPWKKERSMQMNGVKHSTFRTE